jgi:hypothetical protein
VVLAKVTDGATTMAMTAHNVSMLTRRRMSAIKREPSLDFDAKIRCLDLQFVLFAFFGFPLSALMRKPKSAGNQIV